MKIYLSHKRSPDQFALYDSLRQLKHDFVFPHEHSEEVYNVKERLKNKEFDLVIAEVSEPATGQGIELGWANIFEIPILCIYKTGSKISSSLKLLTDDFIEYENLSELHDLLDKRLLKN